MCCDKPFQNNFFIFKISLMLFIIRSVFYKCMRDGAKYDLVLFPLFHQSEREVELEQTKILKRSTKSSHLGNTYFEPVLRLRLHHFKPNRCTCSSVKGWRNWTERKVSQNKPSIATRHCRKQNHRILLILQSTV